MSSPSKEKGAGRDSSRSSALPLVPTIITVIVVALQYSGGPDCGLTRKIAPDLETALRAGADIVLIPAVLAGLVVVLRGLTMERCSTQWKWEIVKGLALIAIPATLTLLCAVLFGTDQMT